MGGVKRSGPRKGAPSKRVAMLPSIGIRELRGSLSAHLRGVRGGRTLTVTDHGEPIAMIIPIGVPQGVSRLLAEGGATWSGEKPNVELPAFRLRGRPTASELVSLMREERQRALAPRTRSRRPA